MVKVELLSQQLLEGVQSDARAVAVAGAGARAAVRCAGERLADSWREWTGRVGEEVACIAIAG